jgi:hypothetical protein
MAVPSCHAPALRKLLVVALAMAAAACGSSGAAAGDAADAGGDAAAEAPPPGPPTCADYCATIQAACAATRPQYSNDDDCLASCKAFPVGAADDTSGDTLGCRLAFARKAAAGAAMAAAHCTHAGPGGDGVCGENCAGYCDIALMYCTDANQAKLYDTRAACLSDCATRLTDMKLDTGDTARTDMGNQVACLLYHAQMGAVAPSGHCLGDLAGDTCK